MYDEILYGPYGKIPLRLTGEAASHYGSYESLPWEVQEVLQMLIHAVVQLEKEIASAKGGVLFITQFLMIVNIVGGIYEVSDFESGMSVMSLEKKGDGTFSSDFFSIKQLKKIDPILDYAEQNAAIYGRCG